MKVIKVLEKAKQYARENPGKSALIVIAMLSLGFLGLFILYFFGAPDAIVASFAFGTVFLPAGWIALMISAFMN